MDRGLFNRTWQIFMCSVEFKILYEFPGTVKTLVMITSLFESAKNCQVQVRLWHHNDFPLPPNILFKQCYKLIWILPFLPISCYVCLFDGWHKQGGGRIEREGRRERKRNSWEGGQAVRHSYDAKSAIPGHLMQWTDSDFKLLGTKLLSNADSFKPPLTVI